MKKATFINALCGTALGVLMLSATALAQGPGSGGPQPGTPPTPPDPTAVPIDGGASLLVAAGVGYGVKRLRDYRRAKR